MYVECSKTGCNRKAWQRPGKKSATCDGCRVHAKLLRIIHGELPRRREPVHLTDAENEQLRREERITVRVGQ